MVRYEDDCVGCDWGSCSGCCYSGKSAHLYCDNCEEEYYTLYEYNNKQLCKYCLREAVYPEDDEDYEDDEYDDEYDEEIELDLKKYRSISYDNGDFYYNYEPEYDPYD